VVPVDGAPKPPPRRLTLTSPVITGARAVLMVTAGKGKARAVARALESDAAVREVPSRMARGGTWLLDREAAAELASAR
jgi:6-phosphogluconolactonase